MVMRRGWSRWYSAARRWLRTAGIQHVGAAMVADLMALFERDYEARDAAFVAVEVQEVEA